MGDAIGFSTKLMIKSKARSIYGHGLLGLGRAMNFIMIIADRDGPSVVRQMILVNDMIDNNNNKIYYGIGG